MRRIARLPKPSGAAVVESTAARPSSHCAFRCHATASATPLTPSSAAAARFRSSRPAFPSSSLIHGRLFSTSMARRSADPQKPAEPTTGVEALSEAEPQEQLEADAWPELPDESSTLAVPGAVQVAPLPGQVADSTYTPAESGAGLEEVGGLEGWWEDDRHWDPSLEFRGFGPRAPVTDPAVLQVLARQAVSEALAVQQQQPQNAELLTSTAWARGSDGPAALALQFDVAADGSVAGVRGDVAGVVAGLQAGTEAEAGAAEDVATPAVEEAQALVESWAGDASWKSISLHDVALKFAISKRILQLTGHLLADAHLVEARTVGDLLAVLVRPPKAKKLAEELAADGQLAALPNVSVYGRRVTPIDKHKAVGRWKVIVQELEKRNLPVTGTGGYGKSIERKWSYN
ncbi:uncharacterized protein SPSK_07589 [Sporothrix schenckii 1099-18]|uniref:Large ribosomal subunit protein mL50 n=1 Tax=Sporothrix schenckii 1099-18 TaxID=1397361 RepID=A0A0F2MFX2_SPOSC|nr:uncharacterized protein SPSK_07589 [Sporothrix schenckii 1099-18]KJR87760.1 hypothetical protein SPSK_07589 [Sporothrix schenckii 1099-18]